MLEDAFEVLIVEDDDTLGSEEHTSELQSH